MLQKGDEPVPGYRLEQFLGRGQFGEVWRATSPGRASVALKFLNLSDRQGSKEFHAIQQIKAIRNHPHLAPITALWLLDEEGRILNDDDVEGFGAPVGNTRETLVPNTASTAASPQRLVVATLLCDKSLSNRLDECRQQGMTGVPVDELLRYMDEAAKGIDFLNAPHHELGEGPVSVQHCDIKPENIMLAGGSVMICDYGVSRVLTDARTAATGTSMGGSPAYMAPECIDRKPSRASDQYSLAITYVELRTGELPFTVQSYIGVLEAHRTGNLDLSRLPPGEREVIAKATSVDPEQRYPSTVAMARALRRAVETADGPAPLPRSKKTLAALIGVTLLCLLLAGMLIWRQMGPDPLPAVSATFQLDPPDAQVLVDGRPAQPSAAGRLELTRPAGATIELQVRKEGYQTLTRRFQISQLRSPQLVQLSRGAEYYDRLASEKLHSPELTEELFGQAVADYLQAVRLRSDRYAVKPPFERLLGNPPGQDKTAVHVMALTPDHRQLLARSDLQKVGLWSLESLSQPERTIHDHVQVVHNLVVGEGFAVSSDMLGNLAITPIDAPGETVRPESLSAWAMAIGRAADGPFLVTGDLSGQVHRFPLGHGDAQATLVADLGEQITGLVIPHGGPVVAASASGLVALVPPGGEPTAVREIARIGVDVRCLTASPDGQWIAFSREDADDQGRYSVWIAGVGSGQPRPLPQAPLNRVSALTFTPDSRELVCATEHGELQVWSAFGPGGSGEPAVGVHAATDGSIVQLAFAPYEGWMVGGVNSSSQRGYAALWNLKEPDRGPMLLPVPHEPSRVANVAVTDRWIIAGCNNGLVVFWPLRECMMVKTACEQQGIQPKDSAAGRVTST